MRTKLIEQIADSPKRVRMMFRAALLAVLVAGCYNWIIKPQTCYLYAARQNGRMESKLSEELLRNEALNDQYQKKISEMEEQARQSQKSLFQPEEVRAFLCRFENVASESGCSVVSMTFSDAKDISSEHASQATAVQSRQAEIVAVGYYESFIRFLEKIGQCQQKITINDMRFEPVVPGQAKIRCRAIFTVYVVNPLAQQDNKQEVNHAAAQ